MMRWPELPWLFVWSAVQLVTVVVAVAVALGLAHGWAERRLMEMRADQHRLLEATAERILARLERRVEQSEESITGLVKKRTILPPGVAGGPPAAPPVPTREAAKVQKRIAEGEKLAGELARCQFKPAALQDAMTRAQTWAEVTHDELTRLISEEAARDFVKTEGVPDLQVPPAKGCDPVASVARATVLRLLGNLKRVNQALDRY